MKRRFFSLLTMAALVLSLMAAPAQAASNRVELTDGRWVDGVFTVTYRAPAGQTATLVAAAYENGRLAQTQTIPSVRGEETVQFRDLKQSYLVRVFAVDPKGGSPICQKEEVRNPDALKVYQGTVELPLANDAVAAALSSALDAYVEAQLALERYDAYFRAAVKPSVGSDGARSLVDQVVMPVSSPFPARPDLGGAYPKEVPVSYCQSVQTAAAASSELSRQGGTEALSQPTAQDCWRQVTYACAVLNAAAKAEAAELQAEAKAMEAAALQAGPSKEQLEWAQAISDHYDAIQSNRKLAQLAQDMGCDARRAYSQLVMAQNILQGHYANIEGDLNEFWEKTMIATKAGAKVGLFVCATIATGGATAASPAGFVSAGEAVGIVVGGVDATLEVTNAGTKIILGPDSKVVKRFEEKTKPISDVCFLYSLFTGGGDSAGEKLAFLGDLQERKNELYDNIRLHYNVDLKKMEADVLTLNPMDPQAALKLAKELLPKDTDLGLEQENKTKTMDEVLEEFSDQRDSDSETLQEILNQVDPENPEPLKDAVKEFNQDVNEAIQRDYPDNDDHTPTVTEKPPRIWQGFDEDGNLYEETCYGSDGNRLWSKYYDTDTHLMTSEVAVSGTEGSRVEKWAQYYCTEDGYPEAMGRVKEIFYYQENEYGRFEKPWFGLPHLSYYPNGVLAERETANSSEVYDGSGQLSEVHFSDGPGIGTTYSYYTRRPSGCKFDPTGHLMLVQTTESSSEPTVIPHVLYKRTWDIVSMPINNGSEIGHGLRMVDWLGAESDFEVFVTEPNE